MTNEHDDTKDLTEKLSDRELLLLIARRLSNLEERFDGLEARFDGRETNPLPGNFAERFAELEANLRLMREDLQAERQRRLRVEDRLDQLERAA